MNAVEVKFPAICAVHTACGCTYACTKHAQKLVDVMKFMGAHVTVTNIFTTEECANCVNEASKK